MAASEHQSLLPRRPRVQDTAADASDHSPQETRSRYNLRQYARDYLDSRWSHIVVLLLVTVDVAGIFADFLISLYLCDHECCERSPRYASLHEAQDALGIVSMVFSCLFLVELLITLWAFGSRYFASAFRCFDALIIIAGFVVDVCLQGVLEEVGSTIVVLRLWRIVKIVEELSSGAEEQMDQLAERIESLEKENAALRQQVMHDR